MGNRATVGDTVEYGIHRIDGTRTENFHGLTAI